jgi:hypothetical protein
MRTTCRRITTSIPERRKAKSPAGRSLSGLAFDINIPQLNGTHCGPALFIFATEDGTD